MDYEEKLRLAKEALESGSYDKETIEYIFPELKESEDEKIRKEMIEILKKEARDFPSSVIAEKSNSWIVWLEKQGDKDKLIKELGEYKAKYIQEVLEKHINSISNKDDERLKKTTISFLKDFAAQGYENAVECIDWIESQGYQNHVDKVEPKFREGEWFVWKDKYYKVNYNGCGYELFDQNGLSTSWDYKTIEDNAHFWTIEDAKDGDVVVDKSDGTVGIFQSMGHHPDGGSYNDLSYCFLHCRYDDGFFYADFENGNTMGSDDVIPATKEQRNTLMEAMADAGYTFDFDKKELKKIEQKPTWSEEDERMYKAISIALSLKDAEGYLKSWLKSLKDRYTWKPSERMLEALKWAKCEFHPDCPETMEQLQYLYNELKQIYYDRT